MEESLIIPILLLSSVLFVFYGLLFGGKKLTSNLSFAKELSSESPFAKELASESYAKKFASELSDNNESQSTRHIPSNVRREVWRRDQGRCVKCESREKLEFDHIIPVSKGGSNTARNVELLCQDCNRRKSNKIK